MAEVLSVPAHFDRYYQTSSPRCRSPQPPFASHSDTYDHASDFDCRKQYCPYPPRSFSPPPESSASSSPELSSVVSSIESSATSSVASSVCLDDTAKTCDFDNDDVLLFPVYDYGPLNVVSEDVVPFGTDPNEEQVEDEEEEDLRSSVETVVAADAEITLLDSSASDDTFIRHEPTRHVDYLSHAWREEDIWASWRYMVRNRNSHPNAPRLENASWRTWAKEKHRLRTVSPEKLNWLKDCDVTWLYGPLLAGTGQYSSMSPNSPPGSPSEPKSQTYNPKPILKKRSMSELILQRSLSSSSLLKQATAALESQQSNGYKKSTRPHIPGRAYSDVTSFPPSTKGTTTVTQSSQITSRFSPSPSPTPKKHIHFNDQVQQCIAVHQDDDDGGSDYYRDDSADEDALDDADMGRGRCRERRFRDRPIIAMLPSTTLKYVEEPVKKATSFLPFNSFFSRSPSNGKPYLLDDDEDLADLDWAPKSNFAPRKRSPTGDRAMEASLDDDDLQLPTYSYEEADEENPSGLIDRAVDYVNTARDIAHVLWNVGWRR